MASYTPVNAYMDMSIRRFYDFSIALHEILEARKSKTKQ